MQLWCLILHGREAWILVQGLFWSVQFENSSELLGVVKIDVFEVDLASEKVGEFGWINLDAAVVFFTSFLLGWAELVLNLASFLSHDFRLGPLCLVV